MRRLLIISVNGDPLVQLGTLHGGGQCRYILELGRRLVGAGWSIDVFTTLSGILPVREPITEGFWVIRFPLRDGRPYGYDIFQDDVPDLAEKMGAYVVRERTEYRLVLACYWLSGLVAEKLRPILGVPVVMSFCSLGYQKEQARGTGDCLARIDIERSIAASVDHVIAATGSEAAILESVYAVPRRKLTVIPRGVDVDLFNAYL
jgi:glycosyltransferase involved in cell wall biosynthesis